MDLFVARQPIYDLKGELAAYELLYRGGAQSRGADGTSTSQMSLDVIIQSFLEMGLDRITGGHLGYLNFSRDMLLSGCWDLLDRDSVVIELLEDVDADEPVVAACRALTEAGYTLALDDFVSGGSQESLLPFAKIIKLDVLDRPLDEIREVSEPLRRQGLRLLAERVETAGVRDACRGMGFELFQGYFFSRPEIVAKKGVSVEYAAILQLINLLHDDEASDQQIEDTFRRDPSLSFKLLRMVNAASSGQSGIESISHAIRLIGRKALGRWLALLMASSLAVQGGIDGELVQAAILRARLCELLGGTSGRRGASGSLFMTGLFSMMDSLLRAPMPEILDEVDLSEDVKEALLHRGGPYAEWLGLVEAYETGDWDRVQSICSGLGISPIDLPEIYLESLSWVREQVGTA